MYECENRIFLVAAIHKSSLTAIVVVVSILSSNEPKHHLHRSEQKSPYSRQCVIRLIFSSTKYRYVEARVGFFFLFLVHDRRQSPSTVSSLQTFEPNQYAHDSQCLFGRHNPSYIQHTRCIHRRAATLYSSSVCCPHQTIAQRAHTHQSFGDAKTVPVIRFEYCAFSFVPVVVQFTSQKLIRCPSFSHKRINTKNIYKPCVAFWAYFPFKHIKLQLIYFEIGAHLAFLLFRIAVQQQIK